MLRMALSIAAFSAPKDGGQTCRPRAQHGPGGFLAASQDSLSTRLVQQAKFYFFL